MLKNSLFKERSKIYIIAGIVGLASGLTAVLFRWLIVSMALVFFEIPETFGPLAWLFVPAIGGIFVAIIVVKYSPEARGHGVPEVMQAYAFEGGKMRMRVPILKSLASALCIGSGGSCGREGPIAQIGAGIASAIADIMKLNKTQTKTLVVCGLSSGIAATFNAPLGGTLFGIEILAGGIIGFSIVPVILSSVIATAVSISILGAEVSFRAPIFVMSNPLELIFYLMLGLLMGGIAVVWNRGFYKIEDGFDRLRTSKYALPIIGGFLTGVLLVITIYLEGVFHYSGSYLPGEIVFPAITSIGYAFTDAILIGSVGVLALVAFGILKGLATSFTLGSGGSGGVFAPTLTMGAAFGGAFGLVCSYIFPGVIPTPMAYALVGMAALFAGSARAPITCVVILMEMTKDYSLILPLMIAVSSSFLLASLLDDESIYTLKLARKGMHVTQGTHIGVLKSICLSEIMTTKPTLLDPTMKLDEVLKIVDSTHHTKFPVVNSEGEVVGTLITEDLFHIASPGEPQPTVAEMMETDFLQLAPSCAMDGVLQAMMKRDEGHAVIIDPMYPKRMMGFVTKADVLKAYEIAIFRLQQQGTEVENIEPAEILGIGD